MSLCPCLACGHRVCCRRGEWDGWGRGTLLSKAVCGQLPASSTPSPPAQQCQKRGHKPDLSTTDDPAISTIKVILAYLLNFLKSTVSIVWRCGETEKSYGFPLMAQLVKNPSAVQETAGFDPWVGKIPWRRERLPIPVFCPGEFHGQRRLTGYSPWGQRKAVKTTNIFKCTIVLTTGYVMSLEHFHLVKWKVYKHIAAIPPFLLPQPLATTMVLRTELLRVPHRSGIIQCLFVTDFFEHK